MKICYFGDFDPDYARNRVIIKGLRLNGIDVLLCNVRGRGLKKYLGLWRQHRPLRGKYDVLIVGHSDSRWITPLAKLLTRKKVVWDGFYSLYDSWVHDRKLVRDKSVKARYYWFLDWLNGTLADRILTDTNAHIEYFIRTFRMSGPKFIRIFIGADEELFHP